MQLHQQQPIACFLAPPSLATPPANQIDSCPNQLEIGKPLSNANVQPNAYVTGSQSDTLKIGSSLRLVQMVFLTHDHLTRPRC